MVLENCDVLIIGSGPAGCAAAIVCSEAGLNNILITQESNVEMSDRLNIKPSESIDVSVLTLLEKLKIESAVTFSERGIYKGIQSSNIENTRVSNDIGEPFGFHIDKQLFISKLSKYAIERGTKLVYNEKVVAFDKGMRSNITVHTKSGKSFIAKFVIDASGKKTIGGKLLNLNQKFASPPLVAFTGVSKGLVPLRFDASMAHFIPNKNGWTWLAPETDLQYTWTVLQSKGKCKHAIPKELIEHSVISEIKIYNVRWRFYNQLALKRVVMCGDAAGIIDPAAGQGIKNAILSGIMAARTVIGILYNPSEKKYFFNNYNSWFFQRYKMNCGLLKSYYEHHAIDIKFP